VSVGFLGPAGTFADEALIALKGTGHEGTPLPTIGDCFDAVLRGEVDECLVPLENSIEGSVNESLDRLAHEAGRVVVRAEIVHHVRHHLIAAPGIERAEVTRVLSHPHALAQCRRFLRSELAGAQVSAANSTAEAVKSAVETGGGAAAIGSRRAAELYGGAVLAEDIADAPDSRTRFVLIGTEPAPATGPGRFTTLIVCALNRDRPGALLAILQEFAMRAVNLTKLESRPAKTGLGSYIFFIDIEGSRERDLSIDAAISAIEMQGVAEVTVLGAFPVTGGAG
jgi:prephenate dehydratase